MIRFVAIYYVLLLSLATTTIHTAIIIKTKPQVSRMVSVSLNTVIPKKMAVAGSKAPRIAVGVDPISWMAMVVVSKDIAVGNKPKAHRFPHKYHLSAGGVWMPPSNKLRIANKLHPKSST